MIRAALLLAALAAPVAAQTPPPGTRQIRIDVSPAGQAVVKKYIGTPDPFVVQRVSEMRDVAGQMTALTRAPRLDLPRFQALLRRQEALEAAVKRRGNDRMIAMLTELPEPDRLRFLRSVGAGVAGGRPPAR